MAILNCTLSNSSVAGGSWSSYSNGTISDIYGGLFVNSATYDTETKKLTFNYSLKAHKSSYGFYLSALTGTINGNTLTQLLPSSGSWVDTSWYNASGSNIWVTIGSSSYNYTLDTEYESNQTVNITIGTKALFDWGYNSSRWTSSSYDYIRSKNTATMAVTIPAQTYTISYDANGGTGSIASQSKTQGTAITLSSGSGFTRTAYVLSSWNTSADGTGTAYAKSANYTAEGTVTLYAQWKSANPNFTIPTITVTEDTLSWSAFSLDVSSNCKYKVDNGSWQGVVSSTISFPAATISNLSSGEHTVTFYAANASDTSAVTQLTSKTLTMESWPAISSLETVNLNVGGSQTVYISNPLNRNVSITATIGGTSVASSSTTSTFCTLNFTSISTLANEFGSTETSKTITYTSSYSGHTSSITGTLNLTSAIAAPTIDSTKTTSFLTLREFANYTLEGATYSVQSATGGINSTTGLKLLQGKSILGYILNSNSSYNPFSPQYGASLSSYYVTINSSTKTSAILGTQYYEGQSGGVTSLNDAITVTATSPYKLTITATDSRNFSSSYEYTITTVQNKAPSITAPYMFRQDGYGTAVSITTYGSWNLDGANSPKSIILYYKETTAASYSSKTLWTHPSASQSSQQSLNKTYDLSASYSLSFSSDKAYNYYLTVTNCFDQSATTSSNVGTLPLGQPVFMIDTYQKGIGVNSLPSGAGCYIAGNCHVNGSSYNYYLNGTKLPYTYSGTSTPASSLGADGDIYIKYSA